MQLPCRSASFPPPAGHTTSQSLRHAKPTSEHSLTPSQPPLSFPRLSTPLLPPPPGSRFSLYLPAHLGSGGRVRSPPPPNPYISPAFMSVSHGIFLQESMHSRASNPGPHAQNYSPSLSSSSMASVLRGGAHTAGSVPSAQTRPQPAGLLPLPFPSHTSAGQRRFSPLSSLPRLLVKWHVSTPPLGLPVPWIL